MLTMKSVRSIPSVVLGLAVGCAASPPAQQEALVQQEAPADNGSVQGALAVVRARVDTPVLNTFEDAPRSPDADDPAIWVNPKSSGEGLVIGTFKDAGLQVFDLNGKVVQTILPPFLAPISATDPPAFGEQPDEGTSACPGSESGQTFSRFNNVDVHYNFELRGPRGTKKVDIAVVSDRGCDLLRVYGIDPLRADGPLFDITAEGVERIFPERLVQPSPFQPTGEKAGIQENPVDDQKTGLGLTLAAGEDDDDPVQVFVSQREGGVVAELELLATPSGRVTYRRVREYRFDPIFNIPDPSGNGTIQWSPCREEPEEDLQLEGLVVDQQRRILYAAQEVVGIWKIPLDEDLPAVVNVKLSQLMDPVKTFGASFRAVFDGEEFQCEFNPPEAPDSSLPPDTISVLGNPSVQGKDISADVEGLAIYYTDDGEGYLIASSQADDTFHVYNRSKNNKHIGTFQVEGAGETDGHEVINVPVGRNFRHGLFVLQNGEAQEPADTGPVGGFEFDGASQFKLVGWESIAQSLNLDVDTDSFDPRDPTDD